MLHAIPRSLMLHANQKDLIRVLVAKPGHTRALKALQTVILALVASIPLQLQPQALVHAKSVGLERMLCWVFVLLAARDHTQAQRDRRPAAHAMEANTRPGTARQYAQTARSEHMHCHGAFRFIRTGCRGTMRCMPAGIRGDSWLRFAHRRRTTILSASLPHTLAVLSFWRLAVCMICPVISGLGSISLALSTQVRSQAWAQAHTQVPTQAQAQAQAQAITQAQAQPITQAQAQAQAITQAQAQAHMSAQAQAQAQAQAITQAQAQAHMSAQAQAQTQTQAQAITQAQAQPITQAQAQAHTQDHTQAHTQVPTQAQA
jgi:hypothetical protein